MSPQPVAPDIAASESVGISTFRDEIAGAVIRRTYFWHALDAAESIIGGDWREICRRYFGRGNLDAPLRRYLFRRLQRATSIAIYRERATMLPRHAVLFGLITVTQLERVMRRGVQQQPMPTDEEIAAMFPAAARRGRASR